MITVQYNYRTTDQTKQSRAPRFSVNINYTCEENPISTSHQSLARGDLAKSTSCHFCFSLFSYEDGHHVLYLDLRR